MTVPIQLWNFPLDRKITSEFFTLKLPKILAKLLRLLYTYKGPVYGGGGGATGGGYLQTIVITSSPSISKLGWNRTTILFVKTRVGFCNKLKSLFVMREASQMATSKCVSLFYNPSRGHRRYLNEFFWCDVFP